MAVVDAPCYLCGNPINGDRSEDHAVPQQFIKRPQPKAKGFSYGGKLPTHAKCNNEFKDEQFCQSALTLLEVFTDDSRHHRFTYKPNPNINFIALTPDSIPGVNEAELSYFGITNAMSNSVSELKNEEFFAGKPKVDPLKKPINVTLSVIAKTACALLFKKRAITYPPHWRILMVPLMDRAGVMDIQELFGFLKPYEEGLYIWSGKAENGDGAVAFRHNGLVVFVLVTMSRERTFWNKMAELGTTGSRYVFNGSALTELVGFDWTRKSF